MSSAAKTFWSECERYHDLAEAYARNIELAHPNTVSGRLSRCPSDDYCCGFCVTSIKYYEYRGENV
ncbi:hypothetical protein ATJ93_4635 [Halopiger aswanensis]|uniref:Uncharacterized protein n=1 Tax=Halopiger aswanensis TaxID=148449 RepID=A0A3R7EBN0_9EURY|nr:hypothetical protein ATJ93_4635 [Halopiger aswanensis]